MHLSIFKRKRAISSTNTTLQAMLFIPDISGFTEMVRRTDLVTGQTITRELLSTIIRNNRLHMEIAEIEGDAIFFYTWAAPPAADELYAQFELWKIAFDNKVKELEDRFHCELHLHLKAIAHYGPMAAFTIAGFRKLYGEVVIEAHRLLKNSIPGYSYLLVTDELMAVSGQATIDHNSGKLCEMYSGLKSLCFTYTLFECLQPATRHFL